MKDVFTIKGFLITWSDSLYSQYIHADTAQLVSVRSPFLIEDYAVFKISAKEYKAPAPLRKGILSMLQERI